MRLTVKHVKLWTRGGVRWAYHRKTGERISPAPDGRALSDVEIAARAAAINAGLAESAPARPQRAAAGSARRGTFADLVARYKASPEFRQLADATRDGYRRHLEALPAKWRDLAVRELSRAGVRALRDSLADRPAVANRRVAALSAAISWGNEADPAAFGERNVVVDWRSRKKRLREGAGYLPWPANVIEAFRRAAPPELRRVVLAALNTGQRSADVRAMNWVHNGPAGVEVAQEKTRERLLIARTAELDAVLAEIEAEIRDGARARQAVIFTTPTGRAWTKDHLNKELAKTLAAIGHPGYTMHGLRYTAAGVLRHEAGCSWDQVAAILGHRTMRMTRKYADRTAHAGAAVERLDAIRARRKERERDAS